MTNRSLASTASASPLHGVQTLSALVIPLFTSVFRHAETLSEAMDARCYHGDVGRTRLHPLAFSARDAQATLAVAALAVCVAAVDVLF